jgi:hypothetical protein
MKTIRNLLHKVMEGIPYRRSKILIQTVPKGTLLFRKTSRPTDDLRGVKLDDGTRCIHRNYNVFFYPNPFTVEHTLSEWIGGPFKMVVFQLEHDIKVIRLLKPSKYHRNTKNTKRNFIKTCRKVDKGCLPKKIRGYDPCLSDGFMTSHPDIVGMMAIAPGDAKRLDVGLNKKTMKNKLKYFHIAEDSVGSKSVPELALHPLRTRPAKDLIVKDGDDLENNYKMLKIFKSTQDTELREFMDKHTVYDPETFFYRYVE